MAMSHYLVLNALEARRIAIDIIDRQRYAMNTHDCDLWMQTVYSKDSVANQMQRLWFEGYLCHIHPCSIEINLVKVHVCEQNIVATVRLAFEYRDHDPLQECQVYTIAFVPELQAWRIVWITKIAPPFPGGIPDGTTQAPYPLQFLEATDQPAREWIFPEYLALACEASDPLPVTSYAKALPKTVRFREEHPEIECAAVLSNMMSFSVARLVPQVAAPDLLQLLANLYYFSQRTIAVHMTRPDRDNSWTSKLNAPWFGFDEIAAQQKGQEPLIGSCPSVMSLYLAILRLGGYGPLDVFQLRLHNHDVLLIQEQNTVFLLGPDKIVELTPRTLYYTTQVYKVFTDTWFWTRFGKTNVEENIKEQFLRLLTPDASNMRFEYALPRANTTQISLQSAPLLDSCWDDPVDLHRTVKKQILHLSRRYPLSPFTWAKYAYQTLYVRKPEVYATWSLKNAIVTEMLQKYERRQDFFQFMSGLNRSSIFLEDDRLMTADQVLRYRTGDCRAQALLLFTYLKMRERRTAYVLFTRQGAYCACSTGKDWQFWDTVTLEPILRPEGEPVLAFDETSSYSPLLKRGGACEALPEWYASVAKL